MMTRQLATLVTAGIPLVEAVGALIEQVERLELKRVLTQVVDRLNEGSSLAKALEPHPRVFSTLYVSMVGAGEASGTLETVLERLADFMESQSKLRGKVGAALAYPALMMVIGSGLITRDDGRRRPEGDGHLREHGPGAALVHAAPHRRVALHRRRVRCSGSCSGR